MLPSIIIDEVAIQDISHSRPLSDTQTNTLNGSSSFQPIAKARKWLQLLESHALYETKFACFDACLVIFTEA
jgi:hypothetical protein